MSSDPLHPLQNKVISGQYPPGSTFKIVTALAALKAGVIKTSTVIDCKGSINFADHEYHCWKKKGHGKTDLKKALRESCDIWFYRAGLEIGIDKIAEMAFSLGLGKKTGFLLPNEKAGLIPTKAWKKERYNTSWFNGETVISSIGQGFVLTTPMQLAVMMATYANGGTVYQPQILSKIENWRGELISEFEPIILKKTDIDPNDQRAVTRGLEAVISEKKGTGWLARLPKIRVAGKTGTSQVIRSKRDEEGNILKDLPYNLRDHGLFVAFAPVEKPEVAVAVVIEHGEHGSTAAAPVARKMMAAYFNAQKLKDVDNVEELVSD
jgi:penicillin-binding protein 2